VDGDTYTTSTTLTQCGTAIPTGYVTTPSAQPDCCDQDFYTNPGIGVAHQQWWSSPSTLAMTNCPGHDPWDRNCSGKEEHEYPNTYNVNGLASTCPSLNAPTCTCPPNDGAPSNTGTTEYMWQSGDPGCGNAGAVMEEVISGPVISTPGGYYCPLKQASGGGTMTWTTFTQECH
jgi:hypothetical protein